MPRLLYSYIRRSLLIISLTMCSNSFATVGGPENIEVLGLDVKDEKVYFLRHYQDQYSRLPQLYYYDLRSEHPSQPIEVKSIYQKTKRQTQQHYEKSVSNAIDQIKYRLQPLEELDIRPATIFVIDQHVERDNFWQHYDPNDAFEVVRYSQEYQVRHTQYLSELQKSVSYQNNQMKTMHLYDIPNHKHQLAVIEYLGLPIESGYNKQDSVLLKFDPEN